MYTIKSGYKLLTKAYVEESNQGTNIDQGMWKKIWESNLSRKIHIFLWRTLHEILPIKDNMEKRKIQVEKMCSKCFEVKETSYHALSECKVVVVVWKLLRWDWEIDQIKYEKISKWLQNNMSKLSLKQIQ